MAIKLVLREALGSDGRALLVTTCTNAPEPPATSDPRGPRTFLLAVAGCRGVKRGPHYATLSQLIHPAFARNLHGMPPPGFLLSPPASVPHAARRAAEQVGHLRANHLALTGGSFLSGPAWQRDGGRFAERDGRPTLARPSNEVHPPSCNYSSEERIRPSMP